ncbi:pregnancy-associated plasma protein-A-domain-containing protein [Aspergillus carlsbadensis]|nr:pregnancy-associated plasma protein-A-domain-containing protein [Aspergillus carlsbadensis]
MLLSTPATILGLSLATIASAFCGTPEASEAGHAAHLALRAMEAESHGTGSLLARQGSAESIQVYVHVIRDSESDNVPAGDIEEQISVLSEVYATAGYDFYVAASDATIMPNLGPLAPGNAADRRIKEELRRGGAADLNLYIVNNVEAGGAYSTYPWDYQQNPTLDGVVIARAYIPSGTQQGYNTGRSAGHEVGHWLGLYHTFEAGCNEPGDRVDDTPFQASGTTGCPEGRDSCPQAGPDPIHNHMDTSTDACRTEFTSGQVRRMQAAAREYRGI